MVLCQGRCHVDDVHIMPNIESCALFQILQPDIGEAGCPSFGSRSLKEVVWHSAVTACAAFADQDAAAMLGQMCTGCFLHSCIFK